MNKQMKLLAAGAVTMISVAAQAQSLSLKDYLEKVKTQNPQAVSLSKAKEALKERMDEGDLLTTPEFFSEYMILDDRKPPFMPGFQPSRTKVDGYKLGVRSLFDTGTMASVHFGRSNQSLEGMNTGAFPITIENPYVETIAKLELKQSLWRNGFGEKTRADKEQINLASQSQYENTDFNLRQLLLNAENTYWALSSFNEIIELQKGNVENARRTNSWMQGRVKQRLFDDVDGLQTQAAFEARQLEYESSLDEKLSLEREFKKYLNSDVSIVTLESTENYKTVAPANIEALKTDGAYTSQKLMQKSQRAMAKSQRSELRPQLDLIASYAANGKAPEFRDSYNELDNGTQDTWTVGVQFSAPINILFANRLRRGYDNQIQASDEGLKALDYDLAKTKEDLLAQTRDAKDRLQRALDLERISDQIVRKERTRHRNGRTTTFQLLKSEQDLASAQIQRVRAQLGFIQLNNTLRLFSEEL